LISLSQMKTRLTASSETDCREEPLLFQDLGSRKVVADFSGGTLSSDGGVLLVRQMDAGLGLTANLARCFCDQRQAVYVDHTLQQLLAQRIYGLVLGYEDLNDHEWLRLDPLLAVACEKRDPTGQDRFNPAHRGVALAGASTLNRLELSNKKQTPAHKLAHDPERIQACLLQMGVRCLPRHATEIVLDLDAMSHRLCGEQEGGHYRAYYDEYCYLPLYAFVGDYPLWAQVRSGDKDGADGVVAALEQMVTAIRKRCRRARIIVRGDSGFCREEIMAWCESQTEVYYCLGLAKNSVLVERLEPALDAAQTRWCLCGGNPVREFAQFMYQTVKSWSRSRRVIGKAEINTQGSNPRFIVTNLPAHGFADEEDKTRFAPTRLYEELYLRTWGDGKRAQAASAGFARRPDEHALSGEQSTAPLAGGLCVSALGAHAHFGPGRDGTGAGNGGDCPAAVTEGGGPGAGQCAPGPRATEQCLSPAETLPAVPASTHEPDS
jgi:hypothetical protein